MTEEQKKKLREIIGKLRNFLKLIETIWGPFGRGHKDDFAIALQMLTTAFAELVQALADLRALKEAVQKQSTASSSAQTPDQGSSIEFQILGLASTALGAATKLLNDNKAKWIELLQNQDLGTYNTLAEWCKEAGPIYNSEIDALETLLNISPVNQIKINTTPILQIGTAATTTELTVLGQTITLDEDVLSESKVLSQLCSRFGLKKVYIPPGTVLARPERKILFNTALSILQLTPCLNLVVNALVPLPALENVPQKAYTRFTFARDGILTIKLECRSLPSLTTLYNYPSPAAAKKTLQETWKIAAFVDSENAHWTLEELMEVTQALNKIPPRDRPALQGCTFIRIADGPTDSDLAKENGSYDFNKNQLCLTNGAFKLNQTTFVGTGANVGPASCHAILHEVGHAVELMEWRTQGNEGKLAMEQSKQKILQLESTLANLQEQLAVLDAQQKQQIAAYEKAAEEQVAQLANECDNLAAQQKWSKTKCNTLVNQCVTAYNGAIAAYNEAIKSIPRSISMKITDEFDKQLSGLIDLLKALKPDAITLVQLQDVQAHQQAAKQIEVRLLQDKNEAKFSCTAAYQNVCVLIGQTIEAFTLLHTCSQQLAEKSTAFTQLSQTRKQREQELAQPSAKQTAITQDIATIKAQLLETKTLLGQQGEDDFSLLIEQNKKFTSSNRTRRLTAFVMIVKEHNIEPFTPYAQSEWAKGKPQEFFAEAYHIFLNDPEFMQMAAPALYEWFASGKY